MRSKHYRWLIVLLAALIAAGIVACEGDADWDHPNRQRYAAPPEPTNDSMSVEELERAWKARDQQLARSAQVQLGQQPQDQQPRGQSQHFAEGQAATSDMLDVALGYLESAFEAIVSNADEVPATDEPAGRQEAVGGGPPAATPPSADTRTGEM